MINYGEALRAQRETAGLSTVELAKQIGTSHQNISRWESGKVLPNIDFCVKLADFYGITVDELIGRKIR
ncbi:MAG: helix-turn-helix transcriptional regulator [Clostridiales bacterium]|nr:helix-turn-helix transcriptional regulator [Clostridiales bacterium]